MGFILVEQTQTSVEHTKFSLLYFVDHNQTMLVEHNHTMPVEHTNVTRSTQGYKSFIRLQVPVDCD